MYTRGSISHTSLKKNSHGGVTVATNTPSDAHEGRGLAGSANPSYSAHSQR